MLRDKVDMLGKTVDKLEYIVNIQEDRDFRKYINTVDILGDTVKMLEYILEMPGYTVEKLY